MDRIAIMKSFLCVVEEGSFANAASCLGLSRALISRHVAELELQLGTRLLDRNARAVTLTEAGSVHLDFCRRILSQFLEHEETLRGLLERPEGALSIISPKWIGSLDLGDAITAFASRHAAIKVRLELGGMGERTHDLLGNGFDIAFRTMSLRDSALLVRKIATLQFVLCAAPRYLAHAGQPTHPGELAKHQCLLHTGDPIWHFSHEGEAVYIKPAEVSFSSNTFVVLRKAAARGLGVALLPLRSVQREIALEELVPLMPAFGVVDRPLFAVYTAGSSKMRRIQCFLDFIADWYRTNPLPDEAAVAF